ncbi:MAG TPA: hypothetical protein ENN05_09930 [Deltaproteobacteria bacterium]|nr:hypothetical protein [Deltaproteobacteria bacterium]
MHSKQFTGIFSILLFLSLFALPVSCGGGSSSGVIVLSSDKAITAFSFTAAENPQLGADITGTIDEADGTILLAGPLDEDDVAGLKASFTTTGKEVSVGGVVQESAVTANSFAGPLTYRVTAADGSTRDYTVFAAYWKHPSDLADNISPDEQDAWLDVQVAMDNNGNALIVWSQSGGSHHQIFKSEYRSGTWTHPQDVTEHISPDGPDATDSPQVAMDNNGNALIVWHQSDGSTNLIFKSEYRSGVWTHPQALTEYISLDGKYAESPQLAMDDSGNALIVWEQHNGSNWQIFKSEYRSGAWTDPSAVSEGGSVIDPQVAMDDSGNALIVWSQDAGHLNQVFMSEYRGGAWTDPVNISQSEHTAECAQVVMDNNGNALIVWYQSDGDNLQTFKSEYRSGEWTHPSGLADNISPDGQDAYVPQVAMDASGNALITWDQTVDGGNLQIYKSEYRDGGWTHPAGPEDSISPDGDAYNNQVAMNAGGNAVIVWEEYDGVASRILKSEYRGGVWTPPEGLDDGISPDGQDPDFPRVAMDALGNALIVWCQDDGSRRQIFKSEYRFWDE